jgi:putative membrane protein
MNMFPRFGMHGYYGVGVGAWILGILAIILIVAFIVAVIWFIVWLARRGRYEHRTHMTPVSQSPEEILKARYARGEITREQYQQMLEDLKLPPGK